MSWGRALATAVLAAFLTVPAGSHRVAAQERPMVDNVFFQTDLRQAIEDIAAQTGQNIIADPSVQGVVSVTLDNVSLDRALDLVLAGTGYRVAFQPDYILVFNPDAGADFFTDIAETRRVEVSNVSAVAARGLLPQPLQRFVRIDEASGIVVVTAPPELLERIIRDLSVIDAREERQTTFVSLEFIIAENARALLPQNLQRFVRVDAARNTVAVTAPEDNRTEIISMLRRLDVPGAPTATDAPTVYRTRLVKLQHAPAEGVLAMLPDAVQEFVRADPEANALAVSAPRHLVDGIISDINTIDTPRRHVMLDARVVALERSDLLDFGADIRWPQITAGTVVSDATSFPWELRIGYAPSREFTNALALTLNFLSANEQATIVSSPQVMAQDGIASEIRVTTEEFFEILTDVGTTASRSQLERIETGTIMNILPRVGRDGSLTLELDLEVSDVIGRGDNNLPVVSRRTARSTVRVDNGGTAAVAGLVDTRSQVRRSGVPGALTVPLLGRAFRRDSINHQARQVAIFVTATLVDHDRRFSTGERSRPQVRNITDDEFRIELEAALNRLGSR